MTKRYELRSKLVQGNTYWMVWDNQEDRQSSGLTIHLQEALDNLREAVASTAP